MKYAVARVPHNYDEAIMILEDLQTNKNPLPAPVGYKFGTVIYHSIRFHNRHRVYLHIDSIIGEYDTIEEIMANYFVDFLWAD